MANFDYLVNAPAPSAYGRISYEQLRGDWRAKIAAQNGLADLHSSSILSISGNITAEEIYNAVLYNNVNILQAFLRFAVGRNLDEYGLSHYGDAGRRLPEEQDEPYRARLLGLAYLGDTSTDGAIIQGLLTAFDYLSDASIERNYQTGISTVRGLNKSRTTRLTSDQRTAIQTYMNHPDRVVAGDRFSVTAETVIEVAVTATIHYVSVDAPIMDVITAMDAWNGQIYRLGAVARKSNLTTILEGVSGVSHVEYTYFHRFGSAQTNEETLGAADQGTAYYIQPASGNVSITYTAVPSIR